MTLMSWEEAPAGAGYTAFSHGACVDVPGAAPDGLQRLAADTSKRGSRAMTWITCHDAPRRPLLPPQRAWSAPSAELYRGRGGVRRLRQTNALVAGNGVRSGGGEGHARGPLGVTSLALLLLLPPLLLELRAVLRLELDAC
eukprot:CAMPEP_0185556830 /NCGR_PEP_ID=MMETSP1381-20130426/48231_1 /TAXON_ID=298111 /ORGANISM="Pavlova sp., Strain CCMP459" /LENGTH=140 /DNA_ID=CAMNT_0028170239 /DNA_START=421 /DNA_END=841 /DNA_ORIENTATION=-